MAGEYLLDQRGPRTRHAQHKHRIGCIAALLDARSKEFRRGERNQAVDEAGGFVRIVSQFGEAQGIARGIVREG